MTTESIKRADTLLRRSTACWYAATVTGLWLFLIYIGLKLVLSDTLSLASASIGTALSPENLSMAVHMLLAAIILGAGPLQLIPAIRHNYPKLHRWLGRIFMLSSSIALLSGLVLLFTKDIGSIFLKSGFIIQAGLVVIFSYYAIKHAIQKNYSQHRRWALRLFMVVYSAFFLRIIIIAWALPTGGMGIDFETGTGWFIDTIAIGQYMTLAILEGYFYVTEKGSRKSKMLYCALFIALSLITLAGTALLVIFNWAPEISNYL